MVTTLGLDAAVLAGVPVLAVTVTASASAVRYASVDGHKRAALRCAWRIRATWSRTALMVGLVQTDQSAKLGEQIPLDSELRLWTRAPRHLIPRLRVATDAYGVVIRTKTLGRIGLEEWRKAAPYLASAWRVHRVQVSPGKPGWLVVRGMLRDPLTETYTLPAPALPAPSETPVPDAVDLRSWTLGRSNTGTEVRIRTANVSGCVVAGLGGYGKTTLLVNRLSALAVSSRVQFVLIDGKGGADWDDFAPRCWRFGKDDVSDANGFLVEAVRLMRDRHAQIRARLGVKNLWKHGFTPAWPLVVIVIDEAHTFFYAVKGDRDGERLAEENTRAVEELVRKGRDVGIQVILATQKATGDAIPTRIRDNCQVAMSFAQRTSEAATAALGSDIFDHPDAHPRRLLDPAYVGVASLVVEGRSGFTLVRTPGDAGDEQLSRIAESTAHLVSDPFDALTDDLSDQDFPPIAA